MPPAATERGRNPGRCMPSPPRGSSPARSRPSRRDGGMLPASRKATIERPRRRRRQRAQLSADVGGQPAGRRGARWEKRRQGDGRPQEPARRSLTRGLQRRRARTTKRRPRSPQGQASRRSLGGRLRSREAIARADPAPLSSSSRAQVSKSTSGAPLSHRAEVRRRSNATMTSRFTTPPRCGVRPARLAALFFILC
jgi:hypothetical protein